MMGTEAAVSDLNSFLNTVILTAGVFAAIVTSVTNIIISLINNHRLKSIESQKQLTEIDKYRYRKLYELILNWHNYDSPNQGKTANQIAFYKQLNLFLDDKGRYEIAKPLLDECYITSLDLLKEKCEKLLLDLIHVENADGTHSEEFPTIKQAYFDGGIEFSKILKKSINSQLGVLLGKSNAINK